MDSNINRNPVIAVVNGKLSINGLVFELHELREVKQYLQSIGASEALFNCDTEEQVEELEIIVKKMADISPEAAGQDTQSWYLN